jgi:glyoxylase-like metal-dependent hydrolase (beta-lactamase superfamily II)
MQFGDFELHLLSDGTFRLDGGAMFGIVPKPLWQRERPTDERNRIVLAANCPLIRTGKHNILIDCGMGRKWNAKQRDIYAVDEEHDLLKDLANVGLTPHDIDILIHTHLHLDHAGWNSRVDERGEFEPIFVNARHVVDRRELEIARNPNEIQRGTYLAENVLPVDKSTGWQTVDDGEKIVSGVTVLRTGGHTAGHLCVLIESGGQNALFIGEMMPTTSHRHLPWIMAYDSYPLETLEMKRKLIGECVRNNTLVLLDHDAEHRAVRLREGPGGKVEFLPAQ